MRLILLALLLLCPALAIAHNVPEGALATPTAPGLFGLQIVMRWIHVLTAVIIVGGTVFLRLVLVPAAAKVLDETTHASLRQSILARWRKFVHTGILLFIISGLYNYLFVTRFQHEDPTYHMMFGIKFLLALAVFALAVVLTSGKPYAERLQKSALWSGLLITLAVVVVMIGGYMKALH